MGYFVFETWHLVEDFFLRCLLFKEVRNASAKGIEFYLITTWAQGSCSLVQFKSWKDEMHTVTKFRIWEYCWLTTKVCRRLFHVDSIIVRTFCHSSVYNFFLVVRTSTLCAAFHRFLEADGKSFDRGGFWLSRKRLLNLHSQLTSCSECCIFFVWIVVGGEFIFRHKSGSWKLTLPAWRLGSLLCPIWPTFALFRTGRTPVGRG